jgi:hypothetical protein
VNKTKNKLQQGFAVIELAIFAVVIIAVAGIGYWAINKSKAVGTVVQDIAIIDPIAGPAGTPVTLKAPTGDIYKGAYEINFLPASEASGIWTPNVVEKYTISSDGKSLTFNFPSYLCSLNLKKYSQIEYDKCIKNVAYKISLDTSLSISLKSVDRSATGNTNSLFTVAAKVIPYTTPTPTSTSAPTPTPKSEVHPSISGTNPQPAVIGKDVTINKGVTKFKMGRYLIYYHGTNDATNKIPIGDIQNTSETTLTFELPADNAALNAVLKTTSDTTGGIQVKDADGLYSNSYVFKIKAPTSIPTSTPTPISTPTPKPTVTTAPTDTKMTLNVSQPKPGSSHAKKGKIAVAWETNINQKGIGNYRYFLRDTKTDKEYGRASVSAKGTSFKEEISIDNVPVGNNYVAVVQLWQKDDYGNNRQVKADSTGEFKIVPVPTPTKAPANGNGYTNPADPNPAKPNPADTNPAKPKPTVNPRSGYWTEKCVPGYYTIPWLKIKIPTHQVCQKVWVPVGR